MKSSKNFRLAILLFTALSLATPFTFAGEGTAGDYFSGMGIQLGRGVWNVVSSPAEIPCTMRDDIQEKGGTGAATGFGKGIAFFLRRAVIGVSELLTFVMPSEATIPMVCTQENSASPVA